MKTLNTLCRLFVVYPVASISALVLLVMRGAGWIIAALAVVALVIAGSAALAVTVSIASLICAVLFGLKRLVVHLESAGRLLLK